jgi:protein-S-isoprenylcysteine O-methyltransferase Ste14
VAGGLVSAISVFLMGRAWRIGLDPENRTELAEDGPYRWIRHPIYSGWLVILAGTVLAVPDATVDVAALVTVLGILVQALREEQHMARTLGERYARYAARTGRFAPRLWAR